MKQIDHLIHALREFVIYRASLGVSAKIVVYASAQHLTKVKLAAGEIAHAILKGMEWDTVSIDETERTLRSKLLLKDLFYSNRIIIDILQKPFPVVDGNFLSIDAGNYDKIFYDLDTCHDVLLALGLPN